MRGLWFGLFWAMGSCVGEDGAASTSLDTRPERALFGAVDTDSPEDTVVTDDVLTDSDVFHIDRCP